MKHERDRYTGHLLGMTEIQKALIMDKNLGKSDKAYDPMRGILLAIFLGAVGWVAFIYYVVTG